MFTCKAHLHLQGLLIGLHPSLMPVRRFATREVNVAQRVEVRSKFGLQLEGPGVFLTELLENPQAPLPQSHRLLDPSRLGISSRQAAETDRERSPEDPILRMIPRQDLANG